MTKKPVLFKNITALSIDLDDTLWPIAPTIQRAEEATWQFIQSRYPRIPKAFRPSDIQAIRDRVQEQYPDYHHDLSFLRRQVYQAVVRRTGYDVLDGEELFAHYYEWRNKVEFFADVKESLGHLSQRYRLIAVTNGNAHFEKTGIHRYFDDIVYASAVGVAKPHQYMFDAALKTAGCNKEQILHIGDHIQDDVLGALQYGIGAVWVNRSGDSVPELLPSEVLVVNDLHELVSLLNE